MDINSQFANLAAQVGSVKTGSTPNYDPAYNPATAYGGLPLNIAGINTGLTMPEGASNFLAGAGRGIESIVRNTGNMLGLEPTSAINAANRRDAPLMNTGAAQIGNFAGQTAAVLPAMMGGGELAAAGELGSMGAQIVGNVIGRGALEGGIQGLLSADPGHRIGSTILGAGIGSLLPMAGKIGNRLINGLPMSAEARALVNRGVDLTPGQLNPTAQRAASEEAYQSLPVVGATIARARAAPLAQWQQLAIKEGAIPGAQIDPGDAKDMLSAAYKSFEPMYDQAKGFPLRPVIMNEGTDTPLKAALGSAVKTTQSLATAPERKPVAAFLNNELARLDGTSDTLLAARSNIRAKIRQLAMDGDSKNAIPILERGEQVFTDSLRSQLPKNALQALDLADSKYGNYKVLERAVAASKDQLAGLTPSKLSDAVYATTPKAIYARGGGGPLRNLAQEGKAVFDARSPATGHRIGVLGGEAELAAKYPWLGWPLAAARVGSIATPLGRQAARGQLPTQLGAAALRDQINGMIQPDILRKFLGSYARANLGQYLLPQAPGDISAVGTGALNGARAVRSTF